jgi:hypothetical protein
MRTSRLDGAEEHERVFVQLSREIEYLIQRRGAQAATLR